MGEPGQPGLVHLSSSMAEAESLIRVVEDHHIAQDHITTFRFDQHEEGAWIGTASGWVTQVGLPGLHRVCSAPLHAGPVIDSRSWSSSFLSLSAREIIAHSSGGAIQQCLRAPQVGEESFVFFVEVMVGDLG